MYDLDKEIVRKKNEKSAKTAELSLIPEEKVKKNRSRVVSVKRFISRNGERIVIPNESF